MDEIQKIQKEMATICGSQRNAKASEDRPHEAVFEVKCP